jgi:hypothetical protein
MANIFMVLGSYLLKNAAENFMGKKKKKPMPIKNKPIT